MERREKDNGRPSPPNVIAITSGKGGVGKTNVVANLAVSLAMRRRRVLVLDADLGLGNLDVLLGLSPRFNLGHLLRGERRMEEVIIGGPAGISILPAASGINELTNLGAQEKLNLFGQVEGLDGKVDVMLVDTAAGISQNVLFFNMASREIIVVASAEPTSVVDAYALMKVLHLKHGEKRFRLLVNSVKNAREAMDVYRNISMVVDRYLSVSLDYLGYIPYDENLPRAVREQRAVVELFPDSRAARAFSRLAEAVDGIAPSEPKDNVQFFLGKTVQAGCGR